MNDTIAALLQQRADHRARAKKLAEDMREHGRQHQQALKRLEAEYLTKRGELGRSRQVEECVVMKLDATIAREQEAAARSQQEEAELAAHVERLRPAPARLGVAMG